MRRLLAPFALIVLLVAGCSDPGAALSRAESTGVLNVGVVDNPPRAVPEDGGDVSGTDAELISAYADSIGAHPSWQVGQLDALADAVGRGEVDVVIGADSATEGLSATATGPDGGVVLVGDEEDPLRDSLDAWLAERD